MPDLLRFHSPRNPGLVSPSDFSKIGIDSHPPALRSARFTAWQALAAQADYPGLTAQCTAFLASPEAVTSVDDFGGDLPSMLRALLSKGKAITTADIERSLTLVRAVATTELLTDAITRTADTLLAAVFAKRAGDLAGVALQDWLKLLLLVHAVKTREPKFLRPDSTAILAQPILLPAQFHGLNPCSRRIESRSDVFGLAPVPAAKSPATAKPCGCIAVDQAGDCHCEPDETCVDQNPCRSTVKSYVTDLMVVRDEVAGYVPGEISYIENILMGENRTRSHRHLERSEDYTEQATEVSSYTEKDHQATEKFSLQKEVSDTVNQDVSVDAGVTTTLKYGPESAGATLTAHLDASYDWSKDTAQKVAQDYSKDVVDRSLKRVEEKMRELVTQKRIVETEERNKHVFDNTSQGIGGTANISGQYFYVNKVARAQVFSYGRRQICDLLVPEPSELYKRLQRKQFSFALTAPVKPAITPTGITAANYLALVLQYGVTDFEFPPETTRKIVLTFSGGKGHETRVWGVWTGTGPGTDDGPKSIVIPDGFVTDSMATSFSGVDPNLHGLSFSLSVTLAAQALTFGGSATVSQVALPALDGSQSVSVDYVNLRHYTLDLIITCRLNDATLLKWQLGIYNKVMEAYAQEQKNYDDAYAKALEDFNATQIAKRNRNPFLNRETERIELKQLAIAYISGQFYDGMDAMRNKVRPCGFPQMDLPETEREGRIVQFFEQAFEWPFMTYLFYPYFWGRKCTWADKMCEEADDMIFEKFLQSGFARLVIPVRPGFEAQIQHFLAYGEIWEGNDTPPLPGDPYYVSMAQEIREERQNFNADRAGTLAFTRDPAPGAPNNTLTLTDPTAYYWDHATGANGVDALAIASDLDREIIINCKVYRITAIAETIPPSPPVLVGSPPVAMSLHATWVITLDRTYVGADFQDLKWSTGAVYIGAPWEYTAPTQLVWLRGKAKCLPDYPITCEEPQ